MKGPKGILAETISNALAEYFVVDQKSMETKLLSDAGIKLHDTHLQPRDNIVVNPTTTASIRGAVKYVAFQWHWGKSQKEGGSDWVKDARLSIAGLRFTITLSKNETSEGTTTETRTDSAAAHNTNSQNDKKKEATGFMAYVQDQVQRILDTLTLSIENVLFTIILPDDSRVQMGGSGLEIQSLGRCPSPTEGGSSSSSDEDNNNSSRVLLQKLQIKQLYALVVGTDGENYPVLEDVFYEAHIQRSVGNRFAAGLERGLRVEGDSDDNGVVIRAGSTQLQVLNALVGMLVTNTTSAQSSSSDNTTERQESSSSSTSDIETSTPASQVEGEPSFMGLKLSGVCLVLPNDAKLSLSDLILKYQLDGTMLRVEGKAGFAVDGYPFLALGETSAWSADLVESKFRIEDAAVGEGEDPDEEVVAFINARQSEIQKVSDGVNQALGIYQNLNAMEEGAVSSMSQKNSDTKSNGAQETPTASTTDGTTTAAWSMELLGKVGFVVEQESNSEIGVTLRNVKADTQTMTMQMDSIEECHIPGVLHLAEPIVDTKVQLKGGSTLSAIVQDVVVVLADTSKTKDEQKDASGSTSSKSDEAPPYSITLPFGLNLVVNKFLAFKPDGLSVHTTVEVLNLKVDPIPSDANRNVSNVSVHLTLDEINHDMIRLKQPSLGLVVESYDSFRDFKFGAQEIAVAAGYSLGDWKSLIPKKRKERNQKKPLQLPYAHIDKLNVSVMVKGLIGVKDSVIRVSAFDGKETTTISDIIKFYNERVIGQVPGMIADTDILGANVGDGVVGHFGGGFLAKAVGGAGIGGIVSVAAFDGVKNTIKAGKVSRGVQDTDKWKLTDLARGLQYSAISATRAGAAKRGKTDNERGDAIDWTVGATSGVADYTVENKARLGGAGAGALGFAYGFALGGPVGAVAGTIIASASTQKTIEKVDDAFKSDSLTKQKEATDEMIKDLNPRSYTKDAVFQGFLLKRRDFVQWDWRPHCFVLTTEGEFNYYDLSAQHPKGKKNASGVLYMDSSKGPHKSLKFCNHRVEINDSLSKPAENLFAFTIHTFEKHEPLWVLGAPTEQLRSAWVNHLGDQMSKTSDQIGLDLPEGRKITENTPVESVA